MQKFLEACKKKKKTAEVQKIIDIFME